MLRALVVIATLVALSTSAQAHQTSVKYIDLVANGSEVQVTVKCAPGDVTEPMKLPADAKPSVADAVANHDVADFVQRWFSIYGCRTSGPEAHPVDASFLAVTWSASCVDDKFQLDFTHFFELDKRHEAVVRFTQDGRESIETIVRAAEPKLDLRKHPSLLAWVKTGMDHIYDGTDHILFVMSLLLVVMLMRPGGTGSDWKLRGFVLTLKSTGLVITAFTIAHSISLILASLGFVSLPSRFVEAAIAASIAYTAVEDIVKPDVRWRFFLTFGFGLVHGLGFASTLSRLLPPRHVVVPLLCFNVGVEIGQLSIVIVVLPILYLLARGLGAPRYRRYLMPAFAACFAIIAAWWFVQRVS